MNADEWLLDQIKIPFAATFPSSALYLFGDSVIKKIWDYNYVSKNLTMCIYPAPVTNAYFKIDLYQLIEYLGKMKGINTRNVRIFSNTNGVVEELKMTVKVGRFDTLNISIVMIYPNIFINNVPGLKVQYTCDILIKHVAGYCGDLSTNCQYDYIIAPYWYRKLTYQKVDLIEDILNKGCESIISTRKKSLDDGDRIVQFIKREQQMIKDGWMIDNYLIRGTYNKDEECPICKNEDNRSYYLLACNHKMCDECTLIIFQSNDRSCMMKCPTCRSAISLKKYYNKNIITEIIRP